ncbi:Acyl-CoA synthetase (AMP-forming)/AMP-acid ligase II [Amycolatopsis xylanica]|uniref:Acyl-CoA synthetase (AMP-forming)/AMP-acid ligase II n=1 Tax=Amycolatopsis xylanica TaxID=589385 RepID=A0A1H2WD74_9PSEU|nr:AMP-binding protein [Amycolatopsis xylanica]SDW77999.1 Acyl-CoA synthetase (AMP-forming)/AMP-acid ligase II [Amycolatopsis xylanica]
MTHLWDLIRRALRPDTALHLPGEGRSVPAVELITGAESTAAGIVAELGGTQPKRLGLLADNGEPWVRGLFATFRLDAAVVPLPLPAAFAGPDAYVGHLARIARDAELDAILVNPGFARRTVDRLAQALPGIALIDITEAGDRQALPPSDYRGGDAEAVIQYTSGSTSHPKGVVLSHDNVAAGLATINDAIQWLPEDVLGLWLPLFHDMGLFSLLSSFVRGSAVCLWSPSEFVRRPMKWLGSFAASPATALPAPNFFYDYLVAAAAKQGVPDGLDLSGWRLGSNGAEPVQRRTIEAFAEMFGPYGARPELICPTYGMAEATLMVSYSGTGTQARILDVDRDQLDVGRPIQLAAQGKERTRAVVSCGPAAGSVRFRTAEEDGTPLADDVVGEIQITGPPVTRGYLGLPPERQPFTPDGWLRTGDLGFVHDGELYVVGRSKDMIVVRGQNYYAEDVEEIVRTTPGVNGRRGAAFAWADGEEERMAVLWETSADPAESAAIGAAICERLAARLGLLAVQVVPVAPSTIPFTSSGKVKRTSAIELCRKTGLLDTAGSVTRIPEGLSR